MTTPAGEPASAHGVVGGRYQLGALLGSGGMADVYAARDRLLDRDVAIKFFRRPDDRADRARFVTEARLLAGLSHPGLVTVYDACFDDHRRPYLILRLIDGGTLRQRISHEGPLEPGQVARAGMRLATALAHVHAGGIVHRDIKPSNVLIDSAGDHYLADFGLAWALGSARLTNSTELVGTACYLAPEQVTGTAVGHAADIYALGLVLLECLTGRTEYEGSDVEVAVARLSRPPTVPGEFGLDWARLLSAMTAFHPSDRPGAMECARRLHAIAHAGPGDPGTGQQDTARVGVRSAVGDTEDAGPHPTESGPTRRITPARARRARTLRAALGAVGAAGAVLATVVLTKPAGTAGEPVPGRVPGQPTSVPTQRDNVQPGQTPRTTDRAPSPTTTRSPQTSRVGETTSTVTTPAAGQPQPGTETRGRGRAGAEPGRPETGKPPKPEPPKHTGPH